MVFSTIIRQAGVKRIPMIKFRNGVGAQDGGSHSTGGTNVQHSVSRDRTLKFREFFLALRNNASYEICDCVNFCLFVAGTNSKRSSSN